MQKQTAYRIIQIWIIMKVQRIKDYQETIIYNPITAVKAIKGLEGLIKIQRKLINRFNNRIKLQFFKTNTIKSNF